jgi:hypothetical protein
MDMTAAVVIGWLVCGILTAMVASAKNRSEVGWLVLGFCAGIFALIAIAGMPSLPKAEAAPPPSPKRPRPAAPPSNAILGITGVAILVGIAALAELEPSAKPNDRQAWTSQARVEPRSSTTSAHVFSKTLPVLWKSEQTARSSPARVEPIGRRLRLFHDPNRPFARSQGVRRTAPATVISARTPAVRRRFMSGGTTGRMAPMSGATTAAAGESNPPRKVIFITRQSGYGRFC